MGGAQKNRTSGHQFVIVNQIYDGMVYCDFNKSSIRDLLKGTCPFFFFKNIYMM
jgi:hypothetical protein